MLSIISSGNRGCCSSTVPILEPPLVLRNFDPRVTALGRPRSNCTVNYRPVLSSERTLQNNNPQLSEGNFKEKEEVVA
jgi:hypothetical protein